MKLVQLFHNPGAGDEEHSKNDLIDLLEENGYECRYLSTKKKGWEEFDGRADLLVIAGGDGTIRNVIKELLEIKLLNAPPPIALLPLGTANNISKTLGITGETEETIAFWKKRKIKRFDVGRVYDVPEASFFLESFGYGIFPYLIKEMKKLPDESFETPDLKMQKALEVLHDIIVSYEPRYCELEVDGTDHSGKFLLAEIMNTRSIGPNLCISPLADPGDGEFEVVLVPEQHKEKFAAYVAGRLKGEDETYSFHTLKGNDIKISWEGTHVHVDDQIIKFEKGKKITIKLKKGLLEFLVP